MSDYDVWVVKKIKPTTAGTLTAFVTSIDNLAKKWGMGEGTITTQIKLTGDLSTAKVGTKLYTPKNADIHSIYDFFLINPPKVKVQFT